ncbi:MAG: hypothetical protein ACYCQJ_14730 [Nitrososphaerales archaeon]
MFREIFVDILILVYVALFAGFFIDLILPRPKPEESLLRSFIMFWIQIIIDALVCMFVATGFEALVERDADDYYAFTLFTVIFFLVQVQLFDRIDIIYYRLTGRHLVIHD